MSRVIRVTHVASLTGWITLYTCILVILGGLVFGGCASTNTLKLTETEIKVFNRLQKRLKDNRNNFEAALADLKDVAAEALKDEHSLKVSIAKAKLLESMKSPWIKLRPELATTQKEVAFYQLYALAEAEQDVLQARIRERQTSIDEVRYAYDRLVSLMAQIIENEKIVLAELNKPTSAQVSAFLTSFLAETTAFRQQLAATSNEQLRALASDVQKAEERLRRVQELIEQTLGKFPGQAMPPVS